mgnify:CR=1 FL=1
MAQVDAQPPGRRPTSGPEDAYSKCAPAWNGAPKAPRPRAPLHTPAPKAPPWHACSICAAARPTSPPPTTFEARRTRMGRRPRARARLVPRPARPRLLLLFVSPLLALICSIPAIVSPAKVSKALLRISFRRGFIFATWIPPTPSRHPPPPKISLGDKSSLPCDAIPSLLPRWWARRTLPKC